MKYTIELTLEELKVFKAVRQFIYDKTDMLNHENSNFELVLASPLQDTEAYKQGFEDGNKIADKDLKEIQDSTYDVAYNKGYNTAINDYNAMIQWLHDCTDDFKKFINTEYGYGIKYVTNPKVDEGVILYDLICDHDVAEVISEFKKRQEKKKQAEEESIKVGDEVKDLATDNIGVVMSIKRLATYITNNGGIYTNTLGSLEKTGRHFGEIEQLLDKLKNEKIDEESVTR